MEKLLIIDDSVPFLEDLKLFLQKHYFVLTAYSGITGLTLIKSNPDAVAVLLDIRMPDMSGLEILDLIKSGAVSSPPVIIISDYTSPELVVKAIKAGATDFIPKDVNLQILIQKIEVIKEKSGLLDKISYLNEMINDNRDPFICVSEKMKHINELIERFAAMDTDILITGETGSGKDMVAYEIFRRSAVNNQIFLTVPLSSLSESVVESELFGYSKGAFTGAAQSKKGKLESAENGTVYFPEISSISENLQLKLLQFMQYKTFAPVGSSETLNRKLRLRLIFAANENLHEKVNAGALRADFYYRIDTVSINVPPLRERREDILPLAQYFINKFSSRFYGNSCLKLSDDAFDLLKGYDWPGNVRELQNLILKTVALSIPDDSVITGKHFESLQFSTAQNEKISDENIDYETAKRNFKVRYFTNLLRKAGNNHNLAAKMAGITRAGLDKAIKEIPAPPA